MLSILQAVQILHHLRDVHLAGLVLHVGKPAAPDTDHYGNHQDKVFHPVVLRTCGEGGRAERGKMDGFSRCFIFRLFYFFLAAEMESALTERRAEKHRVQRL